MTTEDAQSKSRLFSSACVEAQLHHAIFQDVRCSPGRKDGKDCATGNYGKSAAYRIVPY